MPRASRWYLIISSVSLAVSLAGVLTSAQGPKDPPDRSKEFRNSPPAPFDANRYIPASCSMQIKLETVTKSYNSIRPQLMYKTKLP